MRILLTGAAGFIGFHTTKALLADPANEVLGVDNLNDYYDPAFKMSRVDALKSMENFRFLMGDTADSAFITKSFEDANPDVVVHLAAQAGVRYSVKNPHAYVQANLVGFQNVIELAKNRRVKNFIYASSSSVYGGNKKLPFSEEQDVRDPISFYAATKISNELTARAYGNLFDFPSTGFRFFTVYGPFYRPDMAMFKFAELMHADQPIDIYNHGKMIRDFTHIDDIVKGVLAGISKPEVGQIYNLGRGSSIDLMEMVDYLEQGLGVTAKKNMMPMQIGDVEATLADISKARTHLGFDPSINLREGIRTFTDWFQEFKAAQASR